MLYFANPAQYMGPNLNVFAHVDRFAPIWDFFHPVDGIAKLLVHRDILGHQLISVQSEPVTPVQVRDINRVRH